MTRKERSRAVPVFGRPRPEPGPISRSRANQRLLRAFIEAHPGNSPLWYRLRCNIPGISMRTIKRITDVGPEAREKAAGGPNGPRTSPSDTEVSCRD